jgi:hypothetical protein
MNPAPVRLTEAEKQWALEHIEVYHQAYSTHCWVALTEELHKRKGIILPGNSLHNKIKSYEACNLPFLLILHLVLQDPGTNTTCSPLMTAIS